MADDAATASPERGSEQGITPSTSRNQLAPEDSNDAASTTTSMPSSPSIYPTRSGSFSSVSPSFQDSDEMEHFPPMDRLTIFDFLENLALPQRFEKFQSSISAQKERVKRQQENARKRVVDEWRKRVPPPDEQLQKYRKRMKGSVDRFSERWADTKNVTTREKVSFIAGVLNIFISGYLVGAFPEYFHLWYTAQLCYFYPVRFYTYHKRGYHYFLVDLCYFVNLLLLLVIWVFPHSRRLFIAAFCLAFGNNAVAIAMWKNSLVFHSLDKVTSLFIHVMPCVTLHCLCHLLPREVQESRFPSVYKIKYSDPNSPQHYTLASMIVWSTLPYAMWQLAYHFLITVRRREKIAAGRPTSFTWLRRSYRNTWIGKIVLAQPEALQEPMFMLIQYLYALLTMVPCPIWFWYRWASAGFLLIVFTWSVYNGAVYYIDVFGTRFQKELDQLKRDVAKMQVSSPELAGKAAREGLDGEQGQGKLENLSLGAAAASDIGVVGEAATRSDEVKASASGSGASSEDYSIVEKYAGHDGSSTAVEGQSKHDSEVRERGRTDTAG